jgi:hypothetical protein
VKFGSGEPASQDVWHLLLVEDGADRPHVSQCAWRSSMRTVRPWRTLSTNVALSQELGTARTQIGQELVKVAGEAIEVV